MFFNETGYELLLQHQLLERDDRAVAAVRAPRIARIVVRRGPGQAARHPAALWLAERLVRSGERLREWSAPDTACVTGSVTRGGAA